MIGSPSPGWPAALASVAADVDVFDPGPLFAELAKGQHIEEDRFDYGAGQYDVCVAVGTLDTVNDLPVALALIGRALKPDAPLIGAIAGGNSLPTLRGCLIAAGRQQGRIAARTHPRIEPNMLAQLLVSAGFKMPVVDIDRVRLSYRDLGALVRDLRSMAATSVLAGRLPPISKSEFKRLAQAFEAQAGDGRTEEAVEILHFLAWTE